MILDLTIKVFREGGINFTSRYVFDSERARKVIEFFEEFPEKFGGLIYDFAGQKLAYKLSRLNGMSRSIFLVEKELSLESDTDLDYSVGTVRYDTPPPEAGILLTLPVATGVLGPISEILAFFDLRADVEADSNASFAVEACQSSIAVEGIDNQEGAPTSSLGQEMLCNSLGFAFAFRQIHAPYAVYDDYYNYIMQNDSYCFDSGCPQFIKFPHEVYDAIPEVEPVIRRR